MRNAMLAYQTAKKTLKTQERLFTGPIFFCGGWQLQAYTRTMSFSTCQ